MTDFAVIDIVARIAVIVVIAVLLWQFINKK